MAQAHHERSRYRSTLFWLVISTACSVVGALLVYIATPPMERETLGIVFTLAVVLFPVGVLLVGYRMVVRSIDVELIHPLQQVAEITQAIAEGAVSGSVEVPSTAAPEVRRVAREVNRLAQKATRDIMEMKRLERVRSEFVGNVSHELRTPIFSVQGYLETLLDGAIDDPDVSRQFLEKAYQNALRLNTLLSDLIEISRIESGELRMSFRYFNLCDLLRDVVHTLELRGAHRGVSLKLEILNDQDIHVYGDKERLSQVLTNLIDNAIKYNVDGGSVVVRASYANERAYVSVSDTGIGVPAEHIPRIFERFYRVDKDRSRAVGGTGLGLAIVKHILEAHNSPISVESEPGKGTTISFELKSH